MKTICHSLAGSVRRCNSGVPAILFLLLLLFVVSAGKAQVNAYARVTAISGTTLSVSNVNTTYHTFAAGNQVIIMQMQDDVIGSNTTNASSFGSLSAIANAGLYEVATISSITFVSGVPTAVVLSAALKRTYSTGANSRVQMISFRNYGTNYTVSSAISPLAWDGNVGGVLAIQVAGTLTLSGAVTANGLGFRGGAVSANYESACEPSVYISNSGNYGYKGEGIYLSANAGYTNGRGKIVTGGGGGSDDNGGGGGGGNFTAGGDGGPGWTCTATATASGGLGGITLGAYSAGTRVYMGGGGGGGQENNSVGSAGGNGGGLIFIRAGIIATSCSGSIVLSANGAAAATSGNDGAGGGGAAGTIVLNVGSFSVPASCPLSIRSNGGNGGSVTNTDAHGGGGGGGQGAIYSSIALTAANVSAGTASGAGGANSSTAGATTAGSGAGIANAGVIGTALTSLPVTLTSFTAVKKDGAVWLNWSTAGEYQNQVFNVQRSADGLDFTNIGSITESNNGNTGRSYAFTDRSAVPGKRFYRLEMVDFLGSKDYSATAYINTGELQNSLLVAYPNPARQQFFIQVNSAGDKTYSLLISDLTGKAVYNNTYQPANNLIGVRLDKVLMPGTYLIKLAGNGVTRFGKIMIQ